jgi:hypothetical protein
MPTATQNQPHTPRVRNGEPQPALVGANEPVSAKRDLTSWWKTFSKRAVKKEEEQKGKASVPALRSLCVPRHGCVYLVTLRLASMHSRASAPHFVKLRY